MARKNEADAYWSIFGYLVSGLLFWGGAGYFASRFFHAQYLTLVGLLLGITGAIYLIWLRFGRQ
jgi:ATP synthase protein I